MLKQEEIVKENGKVLVRTYSDSNKYIIQNETKNKYTEAIDLPNKYTYTESNEEIIENTENQNIDN